MLRGTSPIRAQGAERPSTDLGEVGAGEARDGWGHNLRITQSQWCRCGQLRKFVDGNGNVTEWQRDAGERVTKKVQADGTFETHAYVLTST